MAISAKRRVTKRPEERVEELLDAAERLFVERGIDATTIEDITRAAAVAKGTFYLYFSSKDHVLAALRDRLFRHWTAGIDALPPPEAVDDWFAIPERITKRMVEYMFRHPSLVELLTRELIVRDRNEMMNQERNALEMTAAGIQAGMDAGAFHVQDPLASHPRRARNPTPPGCVSDSGMVTHGGRLDAAKLAPLAFIFVIDPLPQDCQEVEKALLELLADHIIELHAHPQVGASNCLLCVKSPAARIFLGFFEPRSDEVP